MSTELSTAAALLAWASAFDNRTVTDESVQAWATALNPNVTIEDGKEAISEHFRRTDDYLMPKHVNYNVSNLRARRLHQIEKDEVPPASLDHDGPGTNRWKLAFRKAIGSGATHEQAYGYACHQVGVPVEIERATVHEITDGKGMPDEIRDMMREISTKPARTLPAWNVPGKPSWREGDQIPSVEVPDRHAFLESVKAQGIPANTTSTDGSE